MYQGVNSTFSSVLDDHNLTTSYQIEDVIDPLSLPSLFAKALETSHQHTRRKDMLEGELAEMIGSCSSLKSELGALQLEHDRVQRELMALKRREESEGIDLRTQNDVLRGDLENATSLAEKQNDLTRNLGEKSDGLLRENQTLHQAMEENNQQLEEGKADLRRTIDETMRSLREGNLSHLISSVGEVSGGEDDFRSRGGVGNIRESRSSDHLSDLLSINSLLMRRLAHHALRISTRISSTFTPKNQTVVRHQPSKNKQRRYQIEKREDEEEEEENKKNEEKFATPFNSTFSSSSKPYNTEKLQRRVKNAMDTFESLR